MFQLNSVGQSDQAAAPTASQNSASATATAASDFKSFLTLLTAQLRNQDPLAPLDSTQFVEQLASFSSVEQQIETNTKLDSIASALAVGDLQGATQWIGKNIEAVSGAARFDGAPLQYRAPDNDSGHILEATVTDRNGKQIYSQALARGANRVYLDR